MIKVFYNDKLKRLFISERVNITNQFMPNQEYENHIKFY